MVLCNSDDALYDFSDFNLHADTEVLYTKVTQQILDRYGKTFEWSLKTKMMGRKPIDGATILVEELQLPMTPEEFHKELYGNLMSMFPDAELMPGQSAHLSCGWSFIIS